MDLPIERFLDVKSTHAEGPFFHAQKNILYWVDILNPMLHRYDFSSSKHKSYVISEPIGFVIPRDENYYNAASSEPGLLIGLQSGLCFFNEDTEEIIPIANPESDLPNNRFNDAKCDADGRLWAGTMDFSAEQAT